MYSRCSLVRRCRDDVASDLIRANTPVARGEELGDDRVA
jgi:hypothetical protein